MLDIMIDFHWKNEANRWRSEICLIRSYADSLLSVPKMLLGMLCTSSATLADVLSLADKLWPEHKVKRVSEGNSAPRWAAESIRRMFHRTEVSMATWSCLNGNPSHTVISWQTGQYGCPKPGAEALSFGHPVSMRRAFCSGSVPTSALISCTVESWKPENVVDCFLQTPRSKPEWGEGNFTSANFG